MKIEEIRHRIAQGKYLIKTHAIQHALKEGFERKNMLEAVGKGKVFENYPQEQRLLICETTELTWGETATRKLKFNGHRENKVAARALTSNELLYAPLFSPYNITYSLPLLIRNFNFQNSLAFTQLRHSTLFTFDGRHIVSAV